MLHSLNSVHCVQPPSTAQQKLTEGNFTGSKDPMAEFAATLSFSPHIHRFGLSYLGSGGCCSLVSPQPVRCSLAPWLPWSCTLLSCSVFLHHSSHHTLSSCSIHSRCWVGCLWACWYHWPPGTPESPESVQTVLRCCTLNKRQKRTLKHTVFTLHSE